jgi:hypothetical protein
MARGFGKFSVYFCGLPNLLPIGYWGFGQQEYKADHSLTYKAMVDFTFFLCIVLHGMVLRYKDSLTHVERYSDFYSIT